MRISVLGLGYVGSVITACMAKRSYSVSCYDPDPQKRAAWKSGRAPIHEPSLQDLVHSGIESGLITIYQDTNDAIRNTDITFISVGTPGYEDGSPDFSQILSACEQAGAAIRNKRTYHTIVIRSTILPGTSEELLIPCLERTIGGKAGRDFGYLVHPEFLREGNAIEDYFHPSRIVIGVWNGSDHAPLLELYRNLEAETIITSIKSAEAIKYVDNSWHALKVCFANEMGRILKIHGMDSHDVMSIFAQDTKLNISTAYLKPGFAFGGSCLPKDVRALSGRSKTRGLSTPVLNSVIASNQDHIRQAIDMIESCDGKHILMLGLSFKPHTDDLRNSPLLSLAEHFSKKPYTLEIYDSTMTGKSFSLLNHLTDDPIESARKADIVVIGHNSDYVQNILRHVKPDCSIIDLVRIDDESLRKQKNYAGICW